MRAEIRYIGTISASNALNTTMLQVLLNGIPQGDDTGMRSGTAVYMRNLSLNYVLYAGDPAGNTARISVVYDKQTNGAAFSEGDVWATTGVPESLRFWNSRSRYVMLYDKVHSLDINKPTVVRTTRKINKFLKFGTATTGVVSNMTKGSVYLCMVSDSGAAPNPSVYANARISYTP